YGCRQVKRGAVMTDKTLGGGRLKLRHVRCFVAIARSGSLLRAAERMAISQPAISKQLMELESIVGATLFERGRHGAQLTREGHRLMPYATQILATLDEGLQAVAGQGDSELAQVRF